MKKLLGPLALLLVLTSCSTSEDLNESPQITKYRIQEALLADANQQLVYTFRDLEEIVLERTRTDGIFLSIDGLRIPISLVNGDQIVLQPDFTQDFQLEELKMTIDPGKSGGYISTDKIIVILPVVANDVAGIVTLTGLSDYLRSNNEGKCLNY